jgi:WD40 repeat protein
MLIGLALPASALAQATERPSDTVKEGALGASISGYKVGGLQLGQTIDLNLERFRALSCNPSTSYQGHSHCSLTKREKEARGWYNRTHSFLLSPDGKAYYINQSLAPAFWGAGEIEADIAVLARQFRQQPKIQRMPPHPDLAQGTIAYWGDITLVPVEGKDIELLAQGTSLNKGYLVDYQNNFSLSARSGLPVYRVKGGAGYVWIASVNRTNRGTLRFFAIDASAIAKPSTAPETAVPPTATVRPKKESADVMIQLGHSAGVTSFAFSPNGRYFASGSNDKTVKLWEVATGRLLRTFEVRSDLVTAV